MRDILKSIIGSNIKSIGELWFEDDEIKEERCITIAFVGDERICDGYYYATSFRQLCKLLAKPELLENPGEVIQDDEL